MTIDRNLTDDRKEGTGVSAVRVALIGLACLALLVACMLAFLGWPSVASG